MSSIVVKAAKVIDDAGNDMPSVISSTSTNQDDRGNLEVNGSSWNKIGSLHLDGKDVTTIFKQALEVDQARIISIPTGFIIEFDDPGLLEQDGSTL